MIIYDAAARQPASRVRLQTVDFTLRSNYANRQAFNPTGI
jgi:hypothetical protein